MIDYGNYIQCNFMNKLLPIAVIAVLAFLLMKGRSDGEVDFPMRMMTAPTPVKSVPKENRIKVVLFTGTEWCPACQQLDRGVISTPAWMEFASKEIQFRSFDFPADRSTMPASAQRMAQQYGVRAFPTMLVLSSDNEVLSKQVGSGPPTENYKAWIRGHQEFY